MRIIRGIILIIVCLIGIILAVFSTYHAYKYFSKNELLNGINAKFNTTEQNNIKEVNDTIWVNKNINSNKVFNNKNVADYSIISKSKESFGLGDIGDFLGGYFGVLIGFTGIIFTFIAFYIQYLANIQVQHQFRLQQFENQFQKMVDVYLNNKDKFSIIGFKNPDNLPVNIEDFSGAKLKDKLKIIISRKKAQNRSRRRAGEKIFIDYTTKDQIVFQKMLVELKVIYRVFMEAYKEELTLNEQGVTGDKMKNLFSISYLTFLFGLNKYSKDFNNINIKFIDNNQINDAVLKNGFIVLRNIREINKIDGTKVYKKFYTDKNGTKKNLWLKLNYEPFKGYMHFLPQYYRNLYSTVKFIVKENRPLRLSKKEKLKYLRILRSTMSDYEQVMLFYNWYSGVGKDWEFKPNKFFYKSRNNTFFTDFKMIHNVKKQLLIDSEIDIYKILDVKDKNNFFENY